MAFKDTVKEWFKTGLKPTQTQFYSKFDFLRWKDEKIPISDIEQIEGILNAKAEAAVVSNHLNNPAAHATEFNAKEDKNQKGEVNGYAPLNEFALIASQYLNIVNDLVTGGATALLSAEQGKVLQTQVSAINTLLTSDNVNLDTLQELVDAIETVQISLSTILVNDLTTGGTTKALTAEMGKTLKGLIDGLLAQVTPAPIYKIGQLCIFKNPDNGSNNDYLEPGDTVIGFVEGEFLNSGTYYGGDPMLLSSYEEQAPQPPAIEFYIRNTSPPSSTIGMVNLGSSYIYRDQGNITYDTHLGNVQDSVGATILNESTDADLIRITYDEELFYYFPDISDFTISVFKINNLVYFQLDIDKEYFMNYDGEATTFTNFSDFRQSDNSLVLYAQIFSDATEEVYTVELFTVVLYPENL